MIDMRDFTFNNPNAALLIFLLIPLLLFQLYLYRYRQQKVKTYTDLNLLSPLVVGRSKAITLSKMVGWSLVWLLISLALMNPIGNLRYRHLATNKPAEENSYGKYRPHEVIFLVDTSASMSVPDGPSNETRLEEAKEIIENAVRQLKGPTISLYSMTSILTSVVPPTMDYLFVRLMLKSLHYNEGDIGGTLYLPVLKELFTKSITNSDKLYSLVILSDGGDNQVESLKGTDKEKAINEIITTIPTGHINFRIFTIGIGSTTPHEIPRVTQGGKPVMSALEPELLKVLASKGRGTYFQAQGEIIWNLSQTLVDQINQDPPLIPSQLITIRKVVPANPEDLIYDLYFQIPLGLALLLLLGLLIVPEVK